MSVSKFHRRTGSEKKPGCRGRIPGCRQGGKTDRVYNQTGYFVRATYMVVSPEHPMLDKYKEDIKNWDAIQDYREQAAKKIRF